MEKKRYITPEMEQVTIKYRPMLLAFSRTEQMKANVYSPDSENEVDAEDAL